MTLSELIAELQEIRDEHGEVTVVTEHPGGYFNDSRVRFDGVDAVID